MTAERAGATNAEPPAPLPPPSARDETAAPSSGHAALRIDVISIFPGLVANYLEGSVLGRAQRRGLLDVRVHDLRSAATDAHRSVDDSPFGGGAGMVLMAPPIFATVEAVQPPRPLFLLGPAGRRFDQGVARELAATSGFSLLCGRYEGVDERVREHLVDDELSIGDVVLAGGELAALVVIEATARLVPGVLGNATSALEESFSGGLLEYPHYTRPAEFRSWSVPPVLLSGDHERIRRWRRAQSLDRTRRRRPDLLPAAAALSAEDAALIAEHEGPPDSDERADARADARAEGPDATSAADDHRATRPST